MIRDLRKTRGYADVIMENVKKRKLLLYIAGLILAGLLVMCVHTRDASWAVFPPNWAGFDRKLRENFKVCGLRFLGLFFV